MTETRVRSTRFLAFHNSHSACMSNQISGALPNALDNFNALPTLGQQQKNENNLYLLMIKNFYKKGQPHMSNTPILTKADTSFAL